MYPLPAVFAGTNWRYQEITGERRKEEPILSPFSLLL
jgi:hypothetical protein